MYARDVLKWKKVILVGGSVGGASALLMAGRNQTLVDAVIVENPFISPLEFPEEKPTCALAIADMAVRSSNRIFLIGLRFCFHGTKN